MIYPNRRSAPLLLFAGGDLAFNLYWQSASLYLLFFYTEALHVPIAKASLCYAVAAFWDGFANFALGLWIERAGRAADYPRILRVGAVPLAAAFVLAYWAPPLNGTGLLVWIALTQLLFRTAYTLVNLAYLAMAARISTREDDRALVSAGRMFAGTAGATAVAALTLPLGRMLAGSGGAAAYPAAATVFALAAIVILMLVARSYREDAQLSPRSRANPAQALKAVARNRAFVVLAAAMIAMIIAVTVFDKSILYYFKYRLHDQRAGELTLGWMMLAGGLALSLWLALARCVGVNTVWLAAIVLSIVLMGAFVLIDPRAPSHVQMFLLLMQAAIVGLHFTIWAILPAVIDYGAAVSAIRIETTIIGLIASLQRVAIGIGTIVIGQTLSGAAESAGRPLRLTLVVLPMAFLAIAGAVMLASPLRTGNRAQPS